MTRRSKRKPSAKTSKKSVSEESGYSFAEEITESQDSSENAEASNTVVSSESEVVSDSAQTEKPSDQDEETISEQSEAVKPDDDSEKEVDGKDAGILEKNDQASIETSEKDVAGDTQSEEIENIASNTPEREAGVKKVEEEEANQESAQTNNETASSISVQGENSSTHSESPAEVDAVATTQEDKKDGNSVSEDVTVDKSVTKPQEEVAQIDLTREETVAHPFVPKDKIHEDDQIHEGDNASLDVTESKIAQNKDDDNDSLEMMDVNEAESKSSEESTVQEIKDDNEVTTVSKEKEPVVIELNTNDDLTEGDDILSKQVTHSPLERSPETYKVVDEIDLTKSDDEEMDVGKQETKEYELKYVIPDYDDPDLDCIEIDPEQDSGLKAEETKDFLRYWHPVQDNPQEFTSWTYLLQFVEQDGKLPLARRAFNSFFTRYPLCYGYWKKFSELERKSGNILRAQNVLERGVRAIPLSVDLWVHVIDFYANHYSRPDAGVTKTRAIYERAISAAGQEFRSEKLWNKYIKWESENKDWCAVLAIYDRVIRVLTQHYSILFSDLKSFVSKRCPREFLSEDEFKTRLKNVRQEAANELQKSRESNEEKKDGVDEEKKIDDESMDDAPPGVEDEDKPPTDDEMKAIRAQVIKERKAHYDETEQLVTKIWAYEEGIKRPYFHVKQLERTQLKNWREYLDVEISKGVHNRIVLLFERCLIACALYEDFWLKFTKYMAKQDSKATSKIFERACTIHLPKKPNIHIQWAAHEELQGNTSKATDILQNMDNILPGMAMIRMRRVALERRAGNLSTAEELLRSYVACAVKDKEEIFYTRKLAWFLLKLVNKKDEAKKILKELLPKYRSEVKLYNDLVEMEFQCADAHYPADEKEEGIAMESFDLALTSDKLTEEQKFVFSQRKLEFLEDFGRDVRHLQKVYDEHQKLLRIHKKRTQIDLTSDETPSKKPKVESSSIAVVGTSQLANGASYTATAATTPTYTAQHSAYVSGDPGAYYQQQQSYWNYAKPNDTQTQQQQYNYSQQQWSHYYGTHQ